MKTLEYVKKHIDEFEEDTLLDRRFTKRIIDFFPTSEWEEFGYRYTGSTERTPEEWTEENVIKHLKADTMFGYRKAIDERGISAELMAMVVRAWCKVLQNGLNLNDNSDGAYHIRQFTTVAEHYGWNLSESEEQYG